MNGHVMKRIARRFGGRCCLRSDGRSGQGRIYRFHGSNHRPRVQLQQGRQKLGFERLRVVRRESTTSDVAALDSSNQSSASKDRRQRRQSRDGSVCRLLAAL